MENSNSFLGTHIGASYEIEARFLDHFTATEDRVEFTFSVPRTELPKGWFNTIAKVSPHAKVGSFPRSSPVMMGKLEITPIPQRLPEKVIFNGPATVCIWRGGSKVVAKRQPGDAYSSRAGMIACLLKHAYGSRYLDFLRAHERKDVDTQSIENVIDHMLDVMLGIADRLDLDEGDDDGEDD